MSEVKRFDHVNHAHVDDCAHIENPGGAWVKASDYDARAVPAGHVVVPRELLEELLEAAKDGAAHKGEYLSKKYGEPELFAKFDTLLQS